MSEYTRKLRRALFSSQSVGRPIAATKETGVPIPPSQYIIAQRRAGGVDVAARLGPIAADAAVHPPQGPPEFTDE